MPSTPVDRINRYTMNTDPEATKVKLIAERPTMIQKETRIFQEQATLEASVRTLVASEAAVTSIQVAMYMTFAKEVNRLQGIHPGGAQLNSEVALTLAQWKGRGLTEAVMIRIRNEIFSIPAPTAPGPI